MYDETMTLESVRKKQGLTQVDVSQNMDVTQPQVSGIEAGERILHLWAACQITPHLEGIHPYDLFYHQNLYNAVTFLEAKERKLASLKERVKNFSGFKKIGSPAGMEAMELNSELLDLADDVRVRIKSIMNAFSNFWLSTCKTTGQKEIDELLTRAQDIISQALQLIESLNLDPDAASLFQTSIKPLSTEQIKNRIKNREGD